jgi:hypothetical protein
MRTKHIRLSTAQCTNQAPSNHLGPLIVVTRLLLPAALVTAFLGAATAASAGDFKTGNELLESCQSSNSFDRGLCFGFVEGVSDAMNDGVAERRRCLPAQVVIKQVRDVAVNFLTSHSEWRHKSAATLVAEALEEAFPCPAGP